MKKHLCSLLLAATVLYACDGPDMIAYVFALDHQVGILDYSGTPGGNDFVSTSASVKLLSSFNWSMQNTAPNFIHVEPVGDNGEGGVCIFRVFLRPEFANAYDNNSAAFPDDYVGSLIFLSARGQVEYKLYGPGRGTASNPYKIATLEQLNNVRNELRAHYLLMANIDTKTFNRQTGGIIGGGWTPIGDIADPFTGNFDGNGYSISYGISPTGGETTNLYGLFGAIDGGKVSHLSVNGKIHNEAGLTGGMFVGGIVGVLQAGGEVQACASEVVLDVRAAGSIHAGGIAGWVNEGHIENCFATGAVNALRAPVTMVGGSGFAGGIVGLLAEASSIRSCYATGSISAFGWSTTFIGGIAGAANDNAVIQHCVALNADFSNEAIAHRVLGKEYGTVTLGNNYGNKDMLYIYSSSIWTNNPSGLDGAECDARPIKNWWTNAAPEGPGWTFGSIWVWDATVQLPKLK